MNIISTMIIVGIVLTIIVFIGLYLNDRDWRGFADMNIVTILFRYLLSTFLYIFHTSGIIIKESCSFINGFLNTATVKVIVQWVLWTIFFIAVTLGVLLLFGIIKSLPDFTVKTSDGINMSYTDKKNMNMMEQSSSYLSNFIKQAQGNMALSMGIDVNIPKEGEYAKRKELNVGRCDEIDFVTSGNNCISNKRIKDITWNFSNESEDYKKLPAKFKNKDMEKITIPFSEAGGFYYPDCSRSYYTDKGTPTNLLKNVSKTRCAYVDGDMKKYS